MVSLVLGAGRISEDCLIRPLVLGSLLVHSGRVVLRLGMTRLPLRMFSSLELPAGLLKMGPFSWGAKIGQPPPILSLAWLQSYAQA